MHINRKKIFRISIIIILLVIIFFIPGIFYVPYDESQVIYTDNSETQYIAPCKSLKLNTENLKNIDEISHVIELRSGKIVYYFPWQQGQHLFILNKETAIKSSKRDFDFEGFPAGKSFFIRIAKKNTNPIWFGEIHVKESLIYTIYNYPLGSHNLLLGNLIIIVVLVGTTTYYIVKKL